MAVYFIHSEAMEAVKIGFSEEPTKRLRQLQTGNPERLVLLGSIPGGPDRETELHQVYAERKLLGDWFRFEDLDEVRNLIAEHTDEGEKLLQWFRGDWSTSGKPTAYPELDVLLTLAVGFHCSVYWMGILGPGGKGTEYQVMRCYDGPGQGHDFWCWHLDNNPQFFPTPEHAAIRFISMYRTWRRGQNRN